MRRMRSDKVVRIRMTRDPMTTARNAVENSSRTPVADADILAMLATGEGPGHLVRALFEDCAFETLDRLGAAHGLSRATIESAYAVARRTHAAYNEGLEEPLV